MIEERALVIEVAEGYAWVETQRHSTCGTCSANKGCGTAALATILGKRRTQMRVLTPIPLKAGDQVIIGIEENALVKGSLAVYIVPLFTLMLGATLGELAMASETMSILLGLLGLLGGFIWLWSFNQGIRTDTRFQPRVLRRLAPVNIQAIRALSP